MKKAKVSLISFLILIGSFLVFQSCKKDVSNNNPNPTNIEDLVISDQFNYKTSSEVAFDISVKTNQDVPLKNVRIDLYSDFQENGGKILGSGMTDENGKFIRVHPVPAYLDKLVVATNYLGLPNEVEVQISPENVIQVTLGGSPSKKYKHSSIPYKSVNSVYQPMGTYDANGVPDYLESVNDNIDPEFLDDINASFPENQPVPQFHPEYVLPDNEYDFKLLEPCDVWITFIHEGAGYKNVLGYFTYTIGNAPVSPDEIDTISIIFPNVSFAGSGGGLISGNKVYLGQFPTNTAIGWVLIADGYDFGSGTITNGKGIYFSNPVLNPEIDPDKKQHAVHLLDNGRDIFLLGFEDLNREQWCDNDFNDAMFYVTANPIQAVDITGFQTITYTSDDQDGDGVPDSFDDYPDDPDRAFNNYYPTIDNFGTLAFEDLWPGRGDYDFNDIVIDYQFNQVTNGGNEVVEILGNFVLRAMGASFKNGFGFQMPMLPTDIQSVTGQNLEAGLITLNGNGTESEQDNAVIILFDNGFNVLPSPGSGVGVNTTIEGPYVQPDTMELQILLNTHLPLSEVGLPPYNPFIFTNSIRSNEIHLSDKPPTNLMNFEKFGTFNDDSKPDQGRYYKTNSNLPWGLHIIESFDYAVEKTSIVLGYNYFGNWAESSGQTYSDWFTDNQGYRNPQNIYNKQ